MSERAKRLSRRNFLLAASAGGVASAAAIVAKNSPPSQSPDKDKRATRGYHASEHVNNYYRTTKV
jgi:hypothetical protein